MYGTVQTNPRALRLEGRGGSDYFRLAWRRLFGARLGGNESAGYAVFVVKGGHASNSGILCQLSVNTWQAYNYWGGESFYGFQNVNPN